MVKKVLFLFVGLILTSQVYSQVQQASEKRMRLTGIIRDASTLISLPNSQITVNRIIAAVSDEEGEFSIYVNRSDTVVFSLLGYAPVSLIVSDTLSGNEFLGGVYMKTDTISLAEVVIIPRLPFLKSDILKAAPAPTTEIENARYNVAVSAYQGRVAMSKLGDPSSNYNVLRQQQMINAIDKGGIPSDKMLSLNPLLLVPAAYLLIHGFPQPAPPMRSNLSRQEVDQIHTKYLESLQNRK